MSDPTRFHEALSRILKNKPKGKAFLALGAAIGCRLLQESRVSFIATEFRLEEQERLGKRLIEGHESIVLDADQKSLQWRILNHLKDKGMLQNPGEALEKAWKSAKAASAVEFRRSALGVDKNSKKSRAWRAGLSERELLICAEAATDEFSYPFTIEDFIVLIEKCFRRKRGVDLIKLLSSLVQGNSKRKKMKFHDVRYVTSLLWVSPNLPMWLLTSRNITKFVETIFREGEASRNITPTAITTAISKGRLYRLPEKSRKFLLKKNLDEYGTALRSELSEKLGFNVMCSMPGRRPKPQ